MVFRGDSRNGSNFTIGSARFSKVPGAPRVPASLMGEVFSFSKSMCPMRSSSHTGGPLDVKGLYTQLDEWNRP